MWDDTKFVGFDFETSGTLPEYALQPWRIPQGAAWATSLVTVRHNNSGFDVGGGLFPTYDEMRDILQEAVDSNYTFVGWNSVFDIAIFLAYGLEDLVFKVKWLDGMLLWRHFFIEPEYDMNRANKKSYRLKDCVAEVWPERAGYEDDIDFHTTDPAELAKLHKYNIRDSAYTLRLAKRFYQLLAAEPRRLRAALVEAACLPHVAKANLDGLVVDTPITRELAQHLVDVAAQRLEVLAPHGVTEKVVRSPKQLSELMFDVWKLPVLKENTSKKTGKTSRSTDKEVLYELSFTDERADLIRTYREALGNKTKFADALLKSADYNGDGRTRPQSIVFGTYSGRMTVSSKQGKGVNEVQTGFALHQEKNHKMYRSVIIAPPGYTLMEFDAAGQEFRWMAIASEDEVMLGLCIPGEDPHSYMGSRVTDKEYRKLIQDNKLGIDEAIASRKLGKVANLSLQYRTSAPKLRSVARVQYGIPMELPQAGLIHGTYQRTYQRVPIYWKQQIALTRQCGYVETLAGRRVQVVGNWSGTKGWSMGSTAINYRIQGTGADQKYLALKVLTPYLRKVGAYFAWDLHDGIYFFVPDDKVERMAIDGKYLLDNLPYQKAWGFTPPIPMPWDCKVGKSWGSLKEFDYD